MNTGCKECKKCHEMKDEWVWENGKTYLGIDEHHNPPKFMFEKDEVWQGKLYNLCRECHRKLHDEIIIILNKEAGTLKFNKSEHWVWIKIPLCRRKEVRNLVFNFTEEFINGNI